jgi:hypothetical protein
MRKEGNEIWKYERDRGNEVESVNDSLSTFNGTSTNNVKLDLREVGSENVDLSQLVQEMIQEWAP